AVELERRECLIAFVQQPQVAMERVGELRAHGVELQRERQWSGQNLVRGADRALLELVSRALGCRIEQANGVDLITQQLDAHGLAAWRKDVQDAAAATEQTWLIDNRRRLVAKT